MEPISSTPLMGNRPASHYRYSRLRWIKQLPLACALIGAVVAPLLLVLDFQSPSVLFSADSGKAQFDNVPTSFARNDYKLNADGTPNLLRECEERYFTQKLDHFREFDGTYEQRYFVCDKHSRKQGSIFFYVGNEADVELYLNNTGLMWENAAEFGAMLVFAEHRYFGKSLPYGDAVEKHMEYLSTEQALADYAVLIGHIKKTYELNVPVIGFGGSYGGMLGSWFRMKYPHVIDGVIAASAPILAFMGDVKPVDMEAFARITTFDASAAAGSAANCISNVRTAWQVMIEMGKTSDGRTKLAEAFSLCAGQELSTEEDVQGLIGWAKGAYDYMAMGNYPYPSPYIMNGKSVLPAYPVRVACSHLEEEYAESDRMGLLHGLRDSVGVYYNSTGLESCYSLSAPSNESQEDSDFWQYLFCSELYMPSSINGVDDMFWSIPSNQSADDADCVRQWGIHLQPEWAVTQYGGRKALDAASNIVFSNGNFDPWSGTGVLESVSDSVVYVPVEGGAHHLDLFFSHPLDPPSVRHARKVEKSHMRKWVKEFYARYAAETS